MQSITNFCYNVTSESYVRRATSTQFGNIKAVTRSDISPPPAFLQLQKGSTPNKTSAHCRHLQVLCKCMGGCAPGRKATGPERTCEARSFQIYKYSRRRGAICPGHLASPRGLPDCNPITSHTLLLPLPSPAPFSFISPSLSLSFSSRVSLRPPLTANLSLFIQPVYRPSLFAPSCHRATRQSSLSLSGNPDRVTTTASTPLCTDSLFPGQQGCLGVHATLPRQREQDYREVGNQT